MSRMRRLLAILVAATVFAAPALAQSSAEADDGAAKAKTASGKRTAGLDSIVGRSLRLNGESGQLRLAKTADGKGLRIVELTLSGEVISDPTQKCEISIVADAPIEVTPEKVSPGAQRYTVDIPVCPLILMPLSESVFVVQRSACVFAAADCQANPSDLWGPEANELADQTKRIARDRDKLEASMAASVKTLAKQGEDAAALEKEQSNFEAAREEMCSKYAAEAAHGFCHARLDEKRAIALRKRAANAKPEKVKPGERKKSNEAASTD